MASKKGPDGGASKDGAAKKGAGATKGAAKGGAKGATKGTTKGTTKTAAGGPKRTVNNGNDDGGATVDLVLGEYLLYKVTVSGAVPEFSLVEGDDPQQPVKVLLEPDVPQASYERKWPEAGDLPIASGTFLNHTLAMSFVAALSYRFVVEHRRDDDSLKRVCTDVTWKVPAAQASSRFEPFDVNIA